MSVPDSVRVDRWLWAVRVFKSRSLAAEACASGKVFIGGRPVKPAREVRLGDIVVVAGHVTRTLKVVGILQQRVGAKLVAGYLEDLTPPEAFQRPSEEEFGGLPQRPKGAGRPTKRDRRQMSEWFGAA
jgi:ribosome-associated heat shock protein Hsp15